MASHCVICRSLDAFKIGLRAAERRNERCLAEAQYPEAMLGGRPGLLSVLIGRSAELDRLAALADTVDGGQAPAIAIVGGEAGVGKTRLVSELIARLKEGTAVYAGQADAGSFGRPFELLLDSLDANRANRDERVALLADRDRPTEERLRLGLDIVHDLTSRAPSVLVFDDLHWADAESVALFERLAEHGTGPRLLVGTYRPDALNRRHPVSELLPRLGRRHAVTHIHLGRLSVGDVGSFLAAVYGRMPSYRVIEALHARTGGNPFFLEELLAAAREDDPDKLMSQALPWSLGELVRSQLSDLTAEQRRVVETAAVLGRRVSFDILAVVSGYREDEQLIPILRHLVGQGLLVEAETDIFSFRHALAREAIESDLLGRERRRLHQAALDALRAAGSDDAAAIAHHAHGAGRFGEMVAAARQGARQSLDSGSTYQALQLAELGLSGVGDDPVLLKLAGRAAWLAGLLPEALVHAERRLAVARQAGDLAAQSGALRLVCRLGDDLGDEEVTAASTAELSALVEELDDGAERGKALATLAQIRMLHDDVEGATAWADRAIDLAQRLGLPEVRVRAQIEKGSAFVGSSTRATEGVALLRQGVDEAAAQGQWVIVARGLYNLVRGEYYRPDAVEARVLLARMREVAERVGFVLVAGSYWDGLAEVAEWEGDLGAALAHVEEAVRSQRSLQSAKGGWFWAHAAGLALEAGEVDRADAFFTAVDPEVGSRALWWCGLGLHIAARRGDFDGIRQYADAVTAAAIERGSTDTPLVHDVVRAMLLAGVGPDDVRAFFDGMPIGFGYPAPDEDPYQQLVEAQLLEAAGSHERSLDSYQGAIAHAATWLRPAALGTAHVGAGRCLVALGRFEEAKEHVAVATSLLARWGGTRLEELASLQRRLGGGIPVDGPAELTSREREVAALLAEGLTNGEIGTRLFISPKTASVHVSNILAKLGMTSRSEIAAYAVRSGLVDR